MIVERIAISKYDDFATASREVKVRSAMSFVGQPLSFSKNSDCAHVGKEPW